MQFPPDQPHGTVIEIVPGQWYQYDAGINSWSRVEGLNSVASDFLPGLMTAPQFAKLNRLMVPPPIATIQGNKCSAPFTGGVIRMFGDDYVSVEGSVSLENDPDPGEYEFRVHQNTLAFNFGLDVKKLLDDLVEAGQVRFIAPRGDQGRKGLPGDNGEDSLPVGPQGRDGIDGVSTGGISISAEPLALQSTAGVRKVITSIDPDPNTATIKVNRSLAGDPNAAPKAANVSGGLSYWIIAADRKSGISGQPADAYYVDALPIIEAVAAKYTSELARLKLGYEEISAFWLTKMSVLFDSHKVALCCALERCIGKEKSRDARRYLEQARVQAIQGNVRAQIQLAPRNRIPVKINEPCEGCADTEVTVDDGLAFLTDETQYFSAEGDVALSDSGASITAGAWPRIVGGFVKLSLFGETITVSMPCNAYNAITKNDCVVVDHMKFAKLVRDAVNTAVIMNGGSEVIRPPEGEDGFFGLVFAGADGGIPIPTLSIVDNKLVGKDTTGKFIAIKLSVHKQSGAEFLTDSCSSVYPTYLGITGASSTPYTTPGVVVSSGAPPESFAPQEGGILTSVEPFDVTAGADGASQPLGCGFLVGPWGSFSKAQCVGLYGPATTTLTKEYVGSRFAAGIKVEPIPGAALGGTAYERWRNVGATPKNGRFGNAPSNAYLILDGAKNAGDSKRAKEVELPAGRYTVTVSDCCVQGDSGYRLATRVVYSRNGAKTIANFLDMGVFEDQHEARGAYVGLSITIEHSGGKVGGYIDTDEGVSGLIALDISPVVADAGARVDGVVVLTQEMLLTLENAWLSGSAIGCVAVINSSSYVIVRYMDDDIAKALGSYVLDKGYPAFAWPTLDGTNFVKIAGNPKFTFKQHLNDFVVNKVDSGDVSEPHGDLKTLSPILFPTANA